MPTFDDPKKIYIRERFICRTEIGGRVFSFNLRVEDLDARGILTNVPDLGGATLNPKHEILVRYFRTDSAYQFLSTILAFENRPHMTLMRLSFPRRITRYQRRKHMRLDYSGTVRYRPVDGSLEMIRGHLKDVSTGGLKFSTPRAGMFNTAVSPIGKSVYIEFVVTDGPSFAGITGEIRRLTNDPVRVENVEVQIRFTRIHERTQQRLNAFIRRSS